MGARLLPPIHIQLYTSTTYSQRCLAYPRLRYSSSISNPVMNVRQLAVGPPVRVDDEGSCRNWMWAIGIRPEMDSTKVVSLLARVDFAGKRSLKEDVPSSMTAFQGSW